MSARIPWLDHSGCRVITNVNSKHHAQRVGFATDFALGLLLCQLQLQFLSGNQAVHPLQKHFAPYFPLFPFVFHFCKSHLAHELGSTVRKPYYVIYWAFFRNFLDRVETFKRGGDNVDGIAQPKQCGNFCDAISLICF